MAFYFYVLRTASGGQAGVHYTIFQFVGYNLFRVMVIKAFIIKTELEVLSLLHRYH